MKETKHNMRTTIVVGLIMMILSIQPAFSQDKIFNGARHKVGFQVGYGDQDWKLAGIDLSLDVAYTYEVYFFQFQYYYSLIQRRYFGLDFLFQPQYNISRLRIEDDFPEKTGGYEYGLNGGFLVRWNFMDNRMSLYHLISSGPHFISKTPPRQTSGFIFSDNFNFGVNWRIFRNTYLDLRSGFRHVSNAGIKNPNSGLNTYTFTAGMLFVLPAKP